MVKDDTEFVMRAGPFLSGIVFVIMLLSTTPLAVWWKLGRKVWMALAVPLALSSAARALRLLPLSSLLLCHLGSTLNRSSLLWHVQFVEVAPAAKKKADGARGRGGRIVVPKDAHGKSVDEEEGKAAKL
jgi:hypothetical protein